MKKNILKIINYKNKRPLVCLTAYSKPIAKIVDKYCDIVLVGDSLATAMYGMKNTHQVTLETMIQHGISVKSNLSKSLCVIDMPANSYRTIKEAKKNAILIVKKTKCDAVKIECNGRNFKIIETIVKIGIPVMGHIGFTPQYYKKFKVHGLIKKDRLRLINESKKIEKAGAFSIYRVFYSASKSPPKSSMQPVQTSSSKKGKQKTQLTMGQSEIHPAQHKRTVW